MSKDGIVISNFVGALEGENSKLFQATYKTMSRVFPEVYVFPSNVNSVEYRQNITLLGLKGESIEKFENIFKNDLKCNVPELDCEKFFKNFYSKTFDDDASVLTDRFSPVNRLDNLEERSYIYDEIKNNRRDLQGLVIKDLFVQGGLISAIIIWIHPLQTIWKNKLSR